ncbi:MAG: beta-ketoacyl synthase N-terminal-like domain-containing protein [Candidatus Sumerlaeota bacterium]|nr:beta-ketoacyl synthase N-terminal-like domain-containing protein [Candidatus Sumerlaeota bacterium]
MKGRDVVITGVGMVTPLGATAQETARNWEVGASAPQRFDPALAGTPLERAPLATLPEFDPAKRLGGGAKRMLKYMSQAAVLGCVAAHEAIEDANARQRYAPERIGLYAATGLAAANPREIEGMLSKSIGADGQFSCKLLGEQGLAATNPLLSFKILANMPACFVSILEGIKGPNLIFTPWEGQAAAALIEAWEAVAAGEVDCALAGAADCAANPSTYVALRQMGCIAEHEYPASGAAYLFFEAKEKALQDGQRIYTQIKSLELCSSACELNEDNQACDPLSERMGRAFAAAPAILMGLASRLAWNKFSIMGVDKQTLHAHLS